MKILVVTTDFLPNVSGIATLSFEQARGLADIGHEVTVLTTYPDESASAEDPGGIAVMRVRCGSRPVFRLAGLYQCLRRAVDQAKPDFIWCTNYRGYGLPVWKLARSKRIPYGIYYHGTELITEARNPIRRMIFRRVATGASLVCTNSQNTARILREKYGVQGHAVTPGVTFSDQSKKLSDRTAGYRAGWLEEAQLSDAHDPFVFIAACRVSYQKGIQTVIESIVLLPEELRKRVLFVVIGTGPDKAAFVDLALVRGVSRSILFTGAVDRGQIPAMLSAADAYLQPSQQVGSFLESFGISFLEAQSVGLPCIATRWGGIPEAVKDGETAILVEPGSASAVASAMEKVMTDKSWYEQASETGIAWTKQNTWRKHVEKLDSLLREMKS
jgi:glycosyltransferase involved in cell wall biosynthesis